ncbi:MAG TPA: DUF2934 domain-containing protein [Pirellulales bacterium]|nr:DUF2934 domain-containing protein [Pirellulales bacterium]
MKTTTRQTKHAAVPTPVHVGAPEAKPEYCFPSPDMVARRAYEIWQRHGCPKGTEFQDWIAAEAELRCRH